MALSEKKQRNEKDGIETKRRGERLLIASQKTRNEDRIEKSRLSSPKVAALLSGR